MEDVLARWRIRPGAEELKGAERRRGRAGGPEKNGRAVCSFSGLLELADATRSAADAKAAREMERRGNGPSGRPGDGGRRFEIGFQSVSDRADEPGEYLTTGNDRVTFLLSTNPGVATEAVGRCCQRR